MCVCMCVCMCAGEVGVTGFTKCLYDTSDFGHLLSATHVMSIVMQNRSDLCAMHWG